MMVIVALARGFLIEARRGHLFTLAGGFTAGGLALSFLVGPLALGTDDRITVDMGLSCLLLAAALVMCTGGSHLIAREISSRAVYTTLSRPVSRLQYVLGKFTGLLVLGWGAMVIAFGMLALALWIRGMPLTVPIMQATLLTAGELVVLSAVVTFFATVAGAVPAMLYAAGLFVAGHTLADILTVSVEETTWVSNTLVTAFRWLVPDLARFDMRLHALHGQAIGGVDLGTSWAYGVAYAGAVLAFAWVAFQRRDLE